MKVTKYIFRKIIVSKRSFFNRKKEVETKKVFTIAENPELERASVKTGPGSLNILKSLF